MDRGRTMTKRNNYHSKDQGGQEASAASASATASEEACSQEEEEGNKGGTDATGATVREEEEEESPAHSHPCTFHPPPPVPYLTRPSVRPFLAAEREDIHFSASKTITGGEGERSNATRRTRKRRREEIFIRMGGKREGAGK